MYENIVVGFDDSEYSRAALKEVSHWARSHGSKVTLVHAVYFDTEEFGIMPEQLDRRVKAGKEVCYRTRDLYSSEFGVEIESLVCEGEAPEVILDVAEEKGADLIAMGTYGRKGIKRLIMGSVTSRVILGSNRDVLVVKRPCDGCAGRYESALVPFDGSDSSKKALGKAVALSKMNSTGITLLYVIPRYEEMIGFFKTSSIHNRLLEEGRRIIEQAEGMVSRNGTPVRTMVEEGPVGDRIVEIANNLSNDLIVMGSHGWRGVNKALIGSIAERVIANAAVPILIAR
jgi:nucleotide-binding universal stress UspA family protein